jgi:predicted dehydrogenase
VKSIVSYVLHWNPQIENIKRLVDSGAIGKIYYAEADYWHGIPSTFKSFSWLRQKSIAGGAVIAGGCHAVDMLRWLVGSEIVEVSARSVPPPGNAGNGLSGTGTSDETMPLHFEYATTVTALIRFSNGAIGKIGTCLECRSPYTFNLDLLGTAGTVRDNQIYTTRLMPGQTGFTAIPTVRPDSGDVSHHPFREEIEAFIQAIVNDGNAFPDIEDAVKTQEVCLAIETSAHSDKPVKLPMLKDAERTDAETRGRERTDAETRRRGDAGKRTDAETRGRGDAGKRTDAETRGRGDAGKRIGAAGPRK